MNGIVDQLLPPNTVDFCRKFTIKYDNDCKSSLKIPNQNALLIVKNNIIEIYRLLNQNIYNEHNKVDDTKINLVLHSKHKFVARIESIIVVNEDQVFLSFSNCKVLLILIYFFLIKIKF